MKKEGKNYDSANPFSWPNQNKTAFACKEMILIRNKPKLRISFW